MQRWVLFSIMVAASVGFSGQDSYAGACARSQSYSQSTTPDSARRDRAPKYRPALIYGRDRVSREERRYARKLDRWAKRYHYYGASLDRLERIHRTHYERIARFTDGVGHGSVRQSGGR
ncbi:MAG: hypothetical protein KC978_07855 [Candidatus Omnitrophica bacterium]|nr:hypothetical protein [Candidatus Omnitrophota bacterium]